MGILNISSTNPDFSYIIQKNPNTIFDSRKPFTKNVRKGVAYGWFTGKDARTFRLWFKDRQGDMSFIDDKKETFEYLDKTRYSSPQIALSVITHCFASAFKSRDEKDIGPYTATLSTVVDDVRENTLRNVQKHLPDDVILEWLPMTAKSFRVVLTAPSVFDLLNHTLSIFLLLTFSTSSRYFSINEAQAKKYISVLNSVNAPYFIRYLFKINAFTSPKVFETMREDLDTELLKLSFGNTQQQRIRAVKEVLENNRASTIHEIGFGEMDYTKFLQKDYESVVAYEADEDLLSNAEAKAKARDWDNTTFLPAISVKTIQDNASSFEDADILAVEVFEHMEKIESEIILMNLLVTDFSRIVLTLPNASFNKHYQIEEGAFRHPDHKWEPTREEALAWIEECLDVFPNIKEEVEVKVIQVGDLVSDPATNSTESPTTLIIIERSGK